MTVGAGNVFATIYLQICGFLYDGLDVYQRFTQEWGL